MMKRNDTPLLIVFVFISLLIIGCTQRYKPDLEKLPVTDDPRTALLFDFGWHFYRGDIDGAENPDFDDSSWKLLDIPHDWSIEDIPGTESPLDSTAIGGIDAGYFVGGTGWYRKTFYVPAKLQGKLFRIQFDGVYMNADVWLNGRHLGNHPYGYTSFWFDMTDGLRYGEENVLAVEVKNEGRNSRWYSGSGIYRHVWVTILNPVHIGQWGTCITTSEVTGQIATVKVNTDVVNRSDDPQDVTLVTTLLDPDGEEVAKNAIIQSVEARGLMEFSDDLEIELPKLWSVKTPSLYTARSEIFLGESSDNPPPADLVETSFGIRTISFNTEQGFLLNGKQVLLKGGCMHHDNGPLGAAAYDRAEERRVELMKASGFNSIRCAHNPPSPTFLDACDRLGILVIDEAFDMWQKQKNPQDYHLYFDDWWQNDIESMVFRDRNHPSVIMWSIGNEIPERGEPEGAERAKMLAGYVRQLDDTRPVTSAVNGVAPDKDPFFAALELAGYNYSPQKYVSDHKRLPDRIIYCSESFPLEAFEYWMAVLDYPWVVGDYVWTGFDYLGEASIGWLGYPHKGSFYPWNHAFCGDIDICGFKRPQSFYRDALWGDDKNVSIFIKPPVPSFDMVNPELMDWSKWNWQDVVADWNWPGYEGTPMEIEVYSNCEEVELFLNSTSLGKKNSSRQTEFITNWSVPYQPGVLKAIGYKAQNEVTSCELTTAGEPNQIRLSADRGLIKTYGQDLSYITVELLDENGVRNPKSDNLVQFEIEGPGTVVATGSSNPMSIESYKLLRRKAYQGRCLVIVKANHNKGKIILTASAEGLQPAQVTIVVE